MAYPASKPLLSVSPIQFDPIWIEEVFRLFDVVWIGFSGGVDSHVLLHSLNHQLSVAQREKLRAIYIHHGLSVNADHWLNHCERICRQLGVTFTAEHVQIKTQASLEDAARNARYHAFEKRMGKNDVILLAHHAGDQAETVLFRLLRGTGGKGLAGIPQQRPIGTQGSTLIRPLLTASKDDILRYAHHQQLEWVDDESNLDEAFTRNFLRQSVVPVLKRRFAQMERNIASSAQRVAVDYLMLSQFANQQLTQWCDAFGGLKLSYLADKNLDERLFWWRYFLDSHGVSLPHAQLESIEAMFSSAEDKQPACILTNLRLQRHQNTVYVLPIEQEVAVGVLTVGESMVRPFDEVCVHATGCELKPRPQGIDLLMPNGKTRKLKKWLNDQQVPSWWREHLPYIYQGNELIAIGTLWQHPEYDSIQVVWTVNERLPFPTSSSQILERE